MNPSEEISCIKAFSQGDEQAFELLFLNYQPKLVAFIDGFVQDIELARDLSQDVFGRLWENRENCNEIKSLKAFLFKSAKFAIYNYYDHLLVNEKYVDYINQKSVEFDSVEERIFAQELDNLISATVAEMPEQRRRVFEMSRKLGMTNSEIAERLGISKRTVENHITTALAMLRKITVLSLILFFMFGLGSK